MALLSSLIHVRAFTKIMEAFNQTTNITMNPAPRLISLDFLPTKKDKISDTFVSDNWDAIVLFWSEYGQESSGAINYRKGLAKRRLETFHDSTVSEISKAYHGHMKDLAVTHKLESDRSSETLTRVQAIIDHVLQINTDDSTEDYVKRAINIIKEPIKNKVWLEKAVNSLKKTFNFRTSKEGRKSRTFIDNIASNMLNDATNQAFRRGMLRNKGYIWFERKPAGGAPLLKVKTGFVERKLDMHQGYLAWHEEEDKKPEEQYRKVKSIITEAKIKGITRDVVCDIIQEVFGEMDADSRLSSRSTKPISPKSTKFDDDTMSVSCCNSFTDDENKAVDSPSSDTLMFENDVDSYNADDDVDVEGQDTERVDITKVSSFSYVKPILDIQ